ncbi:MAG: hypothetical protein ACRCX2_35890 [Paraclostridium sp.]
MLKNKIIKTLAFTLATISIFSVGGNVYANGISDLNKNASVSEMYFEKGAGDWVPFSAGGKSYKGLIGAYNNSSGYAYAKQITQTNGWGSVGSGRLGAHANLYRESDGAIVRTADWKYNTQTLSKFENSTSSYSSKGHYYGQGTSKVYTGSQYVTKWCGRSTNTTVKDINTLNINEEEKEIRINLYTNKNMIKAVGENEVEGYISLNDLYDEENQPQTPEEAIAFMQVRAKSVNPYRIISLYDIDGVTEIGEYRIDF